MGSEKKQQKQKRRNEITKLDQIEERSRKIRWDSQNQEMQYLAQQQCDVEDGGQWEGDPVMWVLSIACSKSTLEAMNEWIVRKQSDKKELKEEKKKNKESDHAAMSKWQVQLERCLHHLSEL